jgi:phosphatidate cytidylyltransferase
VALFVAELYSGAEKPFAMIAAVLTGTVYVALPFSLLAELALSNGNYDYRIVLSLFIMLWSNDVGAYCFGLMFGRGGKHKLFERLSPKKSWEGFWGGLIAALSAGAVLHSAWDDRYSFGLFHWLMLSAVVSIAAVFGDLAESMLKRSAGIKDSGHIMPGHGGILDRFDGALLAFPCAMAYINILNLL